MFKNVIIGCKGFGGVLTLLFDFAVVSLSHVFLLFISKIYTQQ